MSSWACSSSDIRLFELARLLVVHTNDIISGSGDKVSAIGLVISAQDFLVGHANRVQLAARGGVPVLNITIGIHSQQHVLRDTGCVQWSPSQIERGHRLFHLGVEEIALLASKHVEYADGAVSTASCNVFVVPVEANCECRDAHITEHILSRYFQV